MFEIVNLIAVASLVLVIVISCVAFVMFLRDLRHRGSTPPHVLTDNTNMMILFQTMRDVVSDQKELARAFNASVDEKVSQIRAMIDAAKAEREELRETQQAILAMLESAKLAVQNAPDTPSPAPLSSASPAGSSPTVESHAPPKDDATPKPGDSVDSEAQFEETSLVKESGTSSDNLIDTWTGLDFEEEERQPPSYTVSEEAVDSPEDAEAARDAFRTLLDLGTARTVAAHETPAEGAHAPDADNGKSARTIVQQRVYEYSDAGMSVSDIAREIGMGKGEIRLILSLRKDEEE